MAENNLVGRQFGKYTILEKLAVGGMAEIYKAKTYGAEGFEKLLAIKRILPHAAEDKEFIDMLIDEAKLSVLLSHANIVQVFDLGKIGSDYFISMEFIHGSNLRDLLYRLREKNAKLSMELAVYIASEVCKGLDYAHRKTDSQNKSLGIVHRDISPQNILISYEGEVKIVDFGIAKAAMNISHTMAGILKGKIAYMSPEQAMGKNIDARTDLFSLGIVLYECVTGKKLYTGESQFEVLKKIRTTRVDINKLPPQIPSPLRTVLAKALAYHLDDRYPSASDMQVALTKYLYATYTDFSPRKLANFIKEVFAEELAKEKLAKEKEKELEIKTGSISVITGKIQEMLVHRETESSGIPKVDITRPVEASVSLPSISRTVVARSRWRQASFLVLLAAVAGGGYWFWRHFTAKPAAPPPPILGTIQVRSDPPGAEIFINGSKTTYQTPAILDQLPLGQEHLLTLAKEHYGRVEKRVRLADTEPAFVDVTLSKNTGLLNLISDPSGAAILVNGIATGKVTPATLDDLTLNTEYRITLSKPSYRDFDQPITLTRLDPEKLMATLESLEAPRQGTLVVETDPPGAKIFLDGLDTGKVTPTKLENLEIKESYALRLERENFEPLIKRIEITSDKPLALVEKLTPKPAPPPTPEPAPKVEPPPLPTTPAAKPKPDVEKKVAAVPKPTPPKAPSPPAPKPKTTGGVGRVQVTSSPSGASVFINGEHRGVTPATLQVSAGSVQLLVSAGEEMMPCRRTLEIGEGQTVNFDCPLGTMFGRIDINSYPPRAEVYFDGKKMNGKTPMIIKRVKRDEEHTLRIELKGYRPWVRAFHLRDKEAQAFNVELEKS